MAIDDETKNRIKKAIQSYTQKNTPSVGPKKTYGAPEKEVEAEALKWLRSEGFHVKIYEAKATYSPKAGRFIQQSMQAGTVDVMGNDKTGRGVFIELKAPGRRSTLRGSQRKFLIEKINTNCFAVCIDSVELLKNQYDKWTQFMNRSQFTLAQDFLRAALPTEKQIEDRPLFDDEM